MTEEATSEVTSEATPQSNLTETVMASTETTTTEPAQEAQEQPSEPSLFEQTEGEIDAESKPEWLPEKFKTGEDLAKSYGELEKKLGAHTGAPEEYKLEVPEGLEDYSITQDDPFAKDFANVLKESGVNQDTYDKIANLYFSKIQADEESIAMAQDEQFKDDCKELGPQGVQDIKDSIKWAASVLPEATYDMLKEVGNKDLTIGKMIKTFHDAYESKNHVEIPEKASAIVNGIDLKQKAMQMQGDDRYGRDPAWTKATEELYESLYN